MAENKTSRSALEKRLSNRYWSRAKYSDLKRVRQNFCRLCTFSTSDPSPSSAMQGLAEELSISYKPMTSASSLSSRVSWMVESVIFWLADRGFGGVSSSISSRSIMSRTKANSSSSSSASFLPCDKTTRTVSDSPRSFEAFLLGSLVIYFLVLCSPYSGSVTVCSQRALFWPDTWYTKHRMAVIS